MHQSGIRRKHGGTQMTQPERIVAAAIFDGRIYSVPAPGRHHDVCVMMHNQGLPADAMKEQGFLTSYGRYVNRKEAFVIAKRENQMARRETHPPGSYNGEELFSEDLW